ncbi:hypothetical protein TWF569_006132 [Orbilia oligospora]|uniref:Proteasome assembly chaperone 3 n=1 Tax=Orbilia oligospora TaxID=2813651 RepID=A0A7C8NDL1_ORBOL|nr:hypothetical protein TWF706_001875 [Orbilia oligospora]KAF3110532.1 hypothetical protein TWF102_008109 [Orbilia oligospora]KAF3114869.1 hypothetical protein TWF103_000590 [Orbilia oligospora]KAF3147038.1 hypothetical protein TWF569_006132 [Orbilia oligospora]
MAAPPLASSEAQQIHQLSVPLPRTADTSLHLHLTIASRHILLFLTTTSANPSFDLSLLSIPGVNSSSTTSTTEDVLNPMRGGDAAVPRGKVGVGSFVYAMPSLRNNKETICTPLILDMATLETTERIARILARRLQVPVYLGNSMNFAAMGAGGSVEEEMGVVRDVVETVVGVWGKKDGSS